MTDPVASCLYILSKKTGAVRTWDILLLVPQILLLIFFSHKKFFNRTAGENTRADSGTSQSQSVIYKRLIWWTVFVSTVRAILSMVLSSFSTLTGWVTLFMFIDKMLWVALSSTLMLCELLVLDFGLSCNMHKYILRVILVFAVAQFVCEQFVHDSRYGVEGKVDTPEQKNSLIAFEHGHAVLWMIHSITFCLIYTIVLLIPRVSKVADWVMQPPFNITIPTKKSFYVYCMSLAVIYWLLAIGTTLITFKTIQTGFCMTDVASYIYYSFYALLLYRLLLTSVMQGSSRDGSGIPGMTESAQYRPLIEEDGSDDELLNLGDQF